MHGTLKEGVRVNRSEIWRIIITFRIKMGWKYYQTVGHPKWELQVGRGLFGICLLILHFKFQFSKSIKSTSHIFLNPILWEKNISFPKCPKITQKCTQNCHTVVNEISREIKRLLKCDRDIGRKAGLDQVLPTRGYESTLPLMLRDSQVRGFDLLL